MNEPYKETFCDNEKQMGDGQLQHHLMIAEAAYYRAEHRGFWCGNPVTDWLEAEDEIDAKLCEITHPDKAITAKEAFQVKIESQLKKWDTKLDGLKNKAKKMKDQLRHDLEAQLEILHARRVVVYEKLQGLRQRSEGAWEDMKEGAEKTLDEMQKAIDSTVNRFK
uniref:Putative methyl-accepting chemotaxis protein Nap3 n=1 Tax=mine drainage metagenome TaxID=410659 RepID=E6QTV4_9ZZZZ